MTRYIIVVHEIIGSAEVLTEILEKILKKTGKTNIVDLCSGSGGPMVSVFRKLKEKESYKNLRLTLSDLYPDMEAAKKINIDNNDDIKYTDYSIDAANVELKGLRTMICSMHHMKQDAAYKILKDAHDKNEPICIFEISDNSFPTYLWWTAIFPAFFMTLIFTPKVQPLKWYHLFFTYVIPLIPLFIAWDGAVSNARTYTKEDLETLISNLNSENYSWNIQSIKAKGPGNMICLTGTPLSL